MSREKNPLRDGDAADIADATLAGRAAAGDANALDTLVRRHHSWIYNLARRFILNPDDATDLAQDALVRIITRVGQFEGRSSFRTWAYRIVANTFVDSKRGRIEQQIVSFDAYGSELDALPMESLQLPAEQEPERVALIEEARNGCMLGMLLCLSREQRLAYILGEIFEAPAKVAAEILELSPVAYRKRLQRARSDLVAFMNDKCGLINTANPCRCERKTRAFIKAGWVDPAKLKFADAKLAALRRVAPVAADQLDAIINDSYAALYRQHPHYSPPDEAGKLAELIRDEQVRATFEL